MSRVIIPVEQEQQYHYPHSSSNTSSVTARSSYVPSDFYRTLFAGLSKHPCSFHNFPDKGTSKTACGYEGNGASAIFGQDTIVGSRRNLVTTDKFPFVAVPSIGRVLTSCSRFVAVGGTENRCAAGVEHFSEIKMALGPWLSSETITVPE